MKTTLLACAAFLTFMAMAPAHADTKLNIMVSSPAALTVKIAGPEVLVARARGFKEGVPFAGCLYEIDWGDGKIEPVTGDKAPFCTSTLKHKYDKPGQYTINVMTYDPGPADGPVNIRRGDMTITVN